MLSSREKQRVYRHRRIRKKVQGTAERPRLLVHRSLRNLQAHIIDDSAGKVIVGKSTLAKDLQKNVKFGGNVEAASVLGKAVAEAAKAKGVSKVCFDRGGYLYHGRIKAFAEAAREAGLEF